MATGLKRLNEESGAALDADTAFRPNSRTAKAPNLEIVPGSSPNEQGMSDARLRQRLLREAFRIEAAEAKAMLARHEIEPLAITTLSAWNAICDECGLVRMHPLRLDRTGEIEVLVDLASLGAYQDRNYGEAAASYDCLVDDPSGVPQDSLFATKILLPEPPAHDVKTRHVLDKARELKVRVAAVPEALVWTETLEEMLVRKRRLEEERRQQEERRREEERQRQLRLLHDPIVYLEFGSAVAVIAQWGDFPVEDEVISRICNSTLLFDP